MPSPNATTARDNSQAVAGDLLGLDGNRINEICNLQILLCPRKPKKPTNPGS